MTEPIQATRVIPAAPDDILEVLRDPEGHVATESSIQLRGYPRLRSRG